MAEKRIAIILDYEEYETVKHALKQYDDYEIDGIALRILSEIKKVKKMGGEAVDS
tara:strand:- start:11 stop:175 length:165 start_codon:yes stop_codon:yes gene_type:complete